MRKGYPVSLSGLIWDVLLAVFQDTRQRGTALYHRVGPQFCRENRNPALLLSGHMVKTVPRLG